MSKYVALQKLSFDRSGTEQFNFEAELMVGASSRGLTLGGRLSDVLAAKITLMIEEEIGEYADAHPNSTGVPASDEDLPF